MKIFSLTLGFLCGFAGLALSKFQIGSPGTKQASFERFDGSCAGHNTPMVSEMHGVRVEGTNLIMNASVTVNEDILIDPTLTVSISRCRSKENLDTCEHFQNYKVTKYCAMLQTRVGLWGPMLGSITPEWKCPFKKDVYRSTDSKVDLAALLILTGGDWYWRGNITLKEKRTNRPLMCLLAEAEVTSWHLH